MNSKKDKIPISAKAYPRVNLLGNPSDIYGGYGLGFPIKNWCAEVFLDFNYTLDEEIPLFRAAREVFYNVCPLQEEFSLSYKSNIPMQSGLAGSSALVMAALRAMAMANRFKWKWKSLADSTLKAEREKLGIIAGPMDRWIQAQEKLLWMNFSENKTKILPMDKLPSFRILVSSKPGYPSGSVHAPIMKRWKNGDLVVKKVMDDYEPLVKMGLNALFSGDISTLARCMDRNFELREKLFSINDEDREIIDLCRKHGSAAKFCGSGGAIIALMKTKKEWTDLENDAIKKGILVVEPKLFKDR